MPSPSQSPTTGESVPSPKFTTIGPAGWLIWKVALGPVEDGQLGDAVADEVARERHVGAVRATAGWCRTRRRRRGTTARHVLPLRRSSKCRCGPVALPVSPSRPIRVPWSTLWPTPDRSRSAGARRAIDSPLPWSTHDVAAVAVGAVGHRRGHHAGGRRDDRVADVVGAVPVDRVRARAVARPGGARSTSPRTGTASRTPSAGIVGAARRRAPSATRHRADRRSHATHVAGRKRGSLDQGPESLASQESQECSNRNGASACLSRNYNVVVLYGPFSWTANRWLRRRVPSRTRLVS